ncbi:MAG: MurR/RpiR family transcriptional regulator, partial [Erysipelotrichaceae bacterium]|nr:MurR/RpiR family transcriptional regulator [Erysipelotrichaceae bacterium]
MITEITKHLEILSETEKTIYNYIMQNPHDVLKMTVRDLAEASYSSPAAIMRFCKKLNLESYNDLKLELAKELKDHDSFEEINVDYPRFQSKTDKQIAREIASMEKDAISKTLDILDMKTISQVVTEIQKAGGISIYGVGFSSDVSQSFETLLKRIGYSVTREVDVSRKTAWASCCDPNNFSIIISYSGNSSVDIARILHKRNMKFVSISGNPGSELKKLSPYFISVPAMEEMNAYNRVAPFTSYTEIRYVLDVIYGILFNRDYSRNSDKLRDILNIQDFR